MAGLDSYAVVDPATGNPLAELAGNTGVARQGEGLAVDLYAQSLLRRCLVKDGLVKYYLDADNSAKRAGGWLRIYEGVNDPLKPIPGQGTSNGSPGLRAGIASWVSGKAYPKGARVLYDGKLWEALTDGVSATPAAGTVAADLTGADGDVMVEIGAFYWRHAQAFGQNAWEILASAADQRAGDKKTPLQETTLPLTREWNGRMFELHPAFQKAGKTRAKRYMSAFQATATDTGNNGSGTLISIADGVSTNTTSVSLTNFRAKIRAKNTGLLDVSGYANDCYSLEDYWLRHALILLVITEIRSLNSSAVFGSGNCSGSNYNSISGMSVPVGNGSGSFDTAGVLKAVTAITTDFAGVTYRGIENLWGNAWTWTDGWVIQNTAAWPEGRSNHYACNTPRLYADGSVTNYELIAQGVVQLGDPATSGSTGPGMATSFIPGTFLPATGYFANNWAVYATWCYYSATAGSGFFAARVGGSASDGAAVGVGAVLVSYAASLVYTGNGARFTL